MNLFTLSTNIAYLFANGILMRNFFKVTFQDSLASEENTPNSANRIVANRMAILNYMYQIYVDLDATLPHNFSFANDPPL